MSSDSPELELQVGCESPDVDTGYWTWFSGRAVQSIECWAIFIAPNLMTSIEILQEKRNDS